MLDRGVRAEILRRAGIRGSPLPSREQKFEPHPGPSADATAGSVPITRHDWSITPRPLVVAPTGLLGMVRPRGEIMAGFHGFQVQYMDRLRQSNGVDLAKAKVTSPASRFLHISLGSGFALQIAHVPSRSAGQQCDPHQISKESVAAGFSLRDPRRLKSAATI